jgi:hypothetical protein
MYKLLNDPISGEAACIIRTSDNAHIPFDSNNVDYQAYAAWVEAGNTATPAE